MAIVRFSDILGQENALGELRASLAVGRLNHAYLFEGAAGTGKYTLARALAARFLCLRPQGDSPCGDCPSCRMLNENNHPDFLELPRDGRYLKIDLFAERPGGENGGQEPVLNFMRYKPLLEHGRVCIIPEAERMEEAAANAFLKTLEEPPAGTLLIMTACARERLIGTILSRCRRIIVKPLAAEAIAAELARRQAPGRENPLGPQALAALAQMAEGSLGIALRLLETEALVDWEKINSGWRDFTPATAVAWAEGILDELAGLKTGNDKRARALYWLDMAALKVRRLARQGAVSGLGTADALEKLWNAGERLNANVRPELVCLTAALGVFAALRGTGKG